jgi:hypothetical protein
MRGPGCGGRDPPRWARTPGKTRSWPHRSGGCDPGPCSVVLRRAPLCSVVIRRGPGGAGRAGCPRRAAVRGRSLQAGCGHRRAGPGRGGPGRGRGGRRRGGPGRGDPRKGRGRGAMQDGARGRSGRPAPARGPGGRVRSPPPPHRSAGPARPAMVPAGGTGPAPWRRYMGGRWGWGSPTTAMWLMAPAAGGPVGRPAAGERPDAPLAPAGPPGSSDGIGRTRAWDT